MTNKFSTKHVKIVSSVSLYSGNSSCHEVRPSRPSGNLPTLGLGDLTLWHEELPDCKETLLF